MAYLDGPGGTQVPQEVIDAMSRVLSEGVSNVGGGFGSSDYADTITTEARRAMADLFNADPNEISFGQNMTSITFAVEPGAGPHLEARRRHRGHQSRPRRQLHPLGPGGHRGRGRGADRRVRSRHPVSSTRRPWADLLDDKVRLVAVCVASNAIGTVVDVESIVAVAHEAGALVYLDAVHAGPHRLLDVRTFDCDFLVASSYKFFGPHTGILYGKLDRLAALDAYKVRPAPSDPPGKMETGTQSFESMAGVTAAVDYLAGLAGDQQRIATGTSGSRPTH